MNNTRKGKPQVEQDMEHVVLEVGRSGDWMPMEDLREAALGALSEGKDVAISVNSLNHLDASALQVLLALAAEQKQRGQNLQLTNVSLDLQKWFDFAGVADQFVMTGRKIND